LEPSEATGALAERIAGGNGDEESESSGFPAPSDSGKGLSGSQAPFHPARRWLLRSGALIAPFGVLAVGWALLRQEGTSPGLADRPPPILAADSLSPTVLAVLPFQAHGSEDETQELAFGVHEEILTYLSKVPGLTVISRRSVEQFARTNLTLQEIALRLHAGSVLEGSVQREGKQVRISVQLIDALTDTHLWARTFYREPRDLLEAQMEIALRVAGTLRASLLYGPWEGPIPDSISEALSRDLLQDIMEARRGGPPDSGR
jgi:TolB-like protein